MIYTLDGIPYLSKTNEPQVHIFMYRNNLEQKNQGTEKFKPNENIFVKVHGGTARRHLASGIDICGQPTKKKTKTKTKLNSLNPKGRTAVTSGRQ